MPNVSLFSSSQNSLSKKVLAYHIFPGILLLLSALWAKADDDDMLCWQIVNDPVATEFLAPERNLDVIRGWNSWDISNENRIRIDDVMQHTPFIPSRYDSAFFLNIDINHDGIEDFVIATDLLQGNGRPSYRKVVNIRAYCSETGVDFVPLRNPCSMLLLGGSVTTVDWNAAGSTDVERTKMDGWVVGVTPLTVEENDYILTVYASEFDEELHTEFVVWSLDNGFFHQVQTCKLED